MDEKVKPLKLDEWRKRGNKLKSHYSSYEEIKEDCLKVFKAKGYYGLYEFSREDLLAILPHYIIEYVDDDRIHMCRDSILFHATDAGYEKVEAEKMIKEMVPILAKSMDKENIAALMTDVLQDLDPPDLLEFYLRAVKLKGSVKPAPGCFKFKIGGKPGMPRELMIRS